MKTTLRVIGVELLLIIILVSGIYLTNPKLWHVRLLVMRGSINNIFYPPNLDDMHNFVRNTAQKRFRIHLGFDTNMDDVDVIDYFLESDEIVRIHYRIKDSETKTFSTRVRWKTWEYYWLHEDYAKKGLVI